MKSLALAAILATSAGVASAEIWVHNSSNLIVNVWENVELYPTVNGIKSPIPEIHTTIHHLTGQYSSSRTAIITDQANVEIKVENPYAIEFRDGPLDTLTLQDGDIVNIYGTSSCWDDGTCTTTLRYDINQRTESGNKPWPRKSQ